MWLIGTRLIGITDTSSKTFNGLFDIDVKKILNSLHCIHFALKTSVSLAERMNKNCLKKKLLMTWDRNGSKSHFSLNIFSNCVVHLFLSNTATVLLLSTYSINRFCISRIIRVLKQDLVVCFSQMSRTSFLPSAYADR